MVKFDTEERFNVTTEGGIVNGVPCVALSLRKQSSGALVDQILVKGKKFTAPAPKPAEASTTGADSAEK